MKLINLFLSFLFFGFYKLMGNAGSFEVTEAMVDQFSANVMHLAQQKHSRLRPTCRMESQNAEEKFYDRIGKRKARRKEGRHSRVVHTDTPHDKRRVAMDTYYDADLVDEEDKLRTIMNLNSEYSEAIGYSLGRQTDEVIIDSLLGTAYSGRSTLTANVLPNAQKVAAHDGAGLTGVGMNVRTLRAVRKKFKQAEAIMPGEKLIMTMAAQQADDLLGQTEFTSSDFASVKALVNGETNTFMGFEFIETELLPFNEAAVTYNKDTGSVGAGTGTIAIGEGRRCIAYTKNRAVICAMGSDVKGRISELPESHYADQVYGKITIGGVRMEEVQVVEVLCKEL